MVQVKSEFQDFYQEAIRCVDLERGASTYNPTWTCRKNGLFCGPGNCLKRPWLRDLMPKIEPKTESKIHETRNENTERIPRLAFEMPKSGFSGSSTDQDSAKPLGKEAGPRIICRKTAKSNSRPHVKAASNLKRVLITFVDKKTKVLQRWHFDCVFLEKKRKPSLIEFRGKRGTSARFYFSTKMQDEDVKSFVGSWFQKLERHDETASVSRMGSPMPFSVDIIEEKWLHLSRTRPVKTSQFFEVRREPPGQPLQSRPVKTLRPGRDVVLLRLWSLVEPH